MRPTSPDARSARQFHKRRFRFRRSPVGPLLFGILVLLAGFTVAADLSHDVGTYLGGSRGEGGYRLPLVFDSEGNLYVAGCTDSSDLPVSEGALQMTYGGRGDLFVAKLSPDASHLLACTYLGGASEDGEWAGVELAIGDDGSIFLAGVTDSAGLATSPGAIAESRIGGKDVYLAKLAPDLSHIVAATYLGGSRNETYVSLAVRNGELLVVGSTTSSGFPTEDEQGTPRGRRSGDLFVCRLNTDLTVISGSHLVRGAGDDVCEALAVAQDGSLLIAGWTTSRDLPVSENATSAAFLGGTYDGFVLRLSEDLNRVQEGTYIGGSSMDFVYAMTLSGSDIWIAGHTASSDLPASTSALQAAYSGGAAGQGDDGFIARLSPDLTQIKACTYYGGSGWENILGIETLGANLAIIGSTTSPDLPISPSPMDSVFAGTGTDYVKEGFVSVLSSTLASLRSGSFLGGSGIDSPGGLAIDGKDGLWVLGTTTSPDLAMTGFSPEFGGGTWRREGGLWGGDLFLLRLQYEN